MMRRVQPCFPVSRAHVADDARWHAHDDSIGRHVACHHSARPDERVLANRHPPQDRGVGADGGARLHQRVGHHPIRLDLEGAVFVDSPRVEIVDEHDPVAHEYAVLDGHALADEGMTGNLTVRADFDTPLDLDEGADGRAGTDPAAVEVDHVGLVDPGAFTEDYIAGDHGTILSLRSVTPRDG